jgi:hypothetical protein
MPARSTPETELFAAKDADAIYVALVTKLKARVGRMAAIEDLKQTCVHITAGRGGTAYAGIHPRKGAVLLNIRLQTPPQSARWRKVEQVSKNRCHCELLLASPSDVDSEVLGWLESASELVSKT